MYYTLRVCYLDFGRVLYPDNNFTYVNSREVVWPSILIDLNRTNRTHCSNYREV